MRQAQVGKTIVELVMGNIVHADTEAIVTAANSSLMGGGGVDGVVHRAAGPQLLAAIRRIGHCPTGGAVVTPAFNLPAPTRRVIHAVGPIYDRSMPERAAELLRGAYTASLTICDGEGLKSVAFPSISTGVYGYPMVEAADVAIAAILDHLRATPRTSLDLVRLVLFNAHATDIHDQALQRALAS